MIRFVASALALLLGGAAQAQTLFADSEVEGAWVVAGVPGQGLMIDALPGGRSLFVAWFTHAPEEGGGQRWYTASLTVNGAFASGPLFLTTGGRLAAPPTDAQQQREVGTMSIDFADCRTATVTYSLTGDDGAHHGNFIATPARELVPGAPACAAVTKLRWPHAAPSLDDAAYARLEADLWIPNNFAQHQGGVAERPGELYLHDGIDILAANGSMIYALEPGTVRDVSVSGANNEAVTVESDERPGEGWSYVHLVPVVANGARIAKGDPVGRVQFTGIEHLHLSRVRKPAGASDWHYLKLLYLNPIGWFELHDQEPPVFRDGLIFLRDLTDTAFADGAPVSGKVDIVAGIRDPGPHARRDFGGPEPYGNHHAVLWVDYEIAGQGTKVSRRAYDFNALQVARVEGSIWADPRSRVIYQPVLLAPVAANERLFSYYRLTHGTGGDSVRVIDGLQAWDTAARDAAGNRLFPDGSYTVTVRAADASGNIAEHSDTVEVRND